MLKEMLESQGVISAEASHRYETVKANADSKVLPVVTN